MKYKDNNYWNLFYDNTKDAMCVTISPSTRR